MPNLADGNSELSSVSTRARMSWAQLLKRVFAIDITTCPQCRGPLTILAAIEDPTVIPRFSGTWACPPARHHESRPASTRSNRRPNLTLDSGSVTEPPSPFAHFPSP